MKRYLLATATIAALAIAGCGKTDEVPEVPAEIPANMPGAVVDSAAIKDSIMKAEAAAKAEADAAKTVTTKTTSVTKTQKTGDKPTTTTTTTSTEVKKEEAQTIQVRKSR